MYKRQTLLSLLIGLYSFAVCQAELPKAELTLRVTDDESGKSVPGAEARISFNVADGKGGTESLSRSGLTDADGRFSAAENALFNVTASARKAGYYPTGLSLDFKPTTGTHYDPVNPTIPVVLRPIVKPVPLYARKNAQINMPVVDQPIGFDLVASDWVAPYGKGITSDLVFALNREAAPDMCSVLTLRFSNDGDGIQSISADPRQGSVLRVPRLAPEAGYEAQWQKRQCLSASMAIRKDQNYFYRVRTAREGGRVESALYGKIYGEIEFDVVNSKTAIVQFTYYLNPDGTTNLECDPKRNLFTKLPILEQVQDP